MDAIWSFDIFEREILKMREEGMLPTGMVTKPKVVSVGTQTKRSHRGGVKERLRRERKERRQRESSSPSSASSTTSDSWRSPIKSYAQVCLKC